MTVRTLPYKHTPLTFKFLFNILQCGTAPYLALQSAASWSRVRFTIVAGSAKEDDFSELLSASALKTRTGEEAALLPLSTFLQSGTFSTISEVICWHDSC